MEGAFKEWKIILENCPEDICAELHIVSIYLWLVKNWKTVYCECIRSRIAYPPANLSERFCGRCDDFLHGLPSNILQAIVEGALKAVEEGENEIREDVSRVERLFKYSGFV